MDLLERTGQRPGQTRHPWEMARLSTVKTLIGRTGLASPHVLDIGCGDGFVIRTLRASLGFERAVGVDVHLTPELCAELSEPGVEIVSTLPPTPERRFDLLLFLDVIEHVEHPVPFLREHVERRLDDAGWVLLTVPAWQALYSRHDEELRHYRRYSESQLQKEMIAAGLDVVGLGGFFASLLPLRALGVARERWFSRATPPKPGDSRDAVGVGGWTHGPLLSRALQSVLAADAQVCLLAERVGLQVPGLSIWALGRKRPR